jgi:hypothetical protein
MLFVADSERRDDAAQRRLNTGRALSKGFFLFVCVLLGSELGASPLEPPPPPQRSRELVRGEIRL